MLYTIKDFHIILNSLREAAKKTSSTNGQAIKALPLDGHDHWIF